MNEVSQSLQTMGPHQYVAAFVFIASYALALSEFSGRRGRWIAAISAIATAIAFALLTDPWEHGVLVVAFALVAMGLFSGTVWLLWAAFGWRRRAEAEQAAH